MGRPYEARGSASVCASNVSRPPNLRGRPLRSTPFFMLEVWCGDVSNSARVEGGPHTQIMGRGRHLVFEDRTSGYSLLHPYRRCGAVDTQCLSHHPPLDFIGTSTELLSRWVVGCQSTWPASIHPVEENTRCCCVCERSHGVIPP